MDASSGRAHLPDSKSGQKTLILPPAALAVLASLPKVKNNPHVIVGGKPGAALVNLRDPWLAIREAAGLDDVRVHDLRHSFASVGAAGGASLPIIGALLGHSSSRHSLLPTIARRRRRKEMEEMSRQAACLQRMPQNVKAATATPRLMTPSSRSSRRQRKRRLPN